MSEALRIATIAIEDQLIPVSTVNGSIYREGVVAQLGKRYSCAQEILLERLREIRNPQTNITSTVRVKEAVFTSGSFSDTEGQPVYLGCGSEALCIKPKVNPAESHETIPMCCGIPMSILKPKVLPSAD